MHAIELRQKAAECHERAAESFERCDTDGFLSQWSNGLSGNLYERAAEIEENGGLAEFWGLFDDDGQRVAAKMIDGRFGQCWALCDENGKFTGRFIPLCDAALEMEMLMSGNNAYRGDDGEYLDRDSAEYAVHAMKDAEKIAKRIAKWEKKHGFRQCREMVPAVAKLARSGRGLSGSAWVATYRKDRGYPAGAKVVG